MLDRRTAQELGLRKYFTGIPCKNGHVCKRRVSNFHCDECEKVEQKRYRQKFPLRLKRKRRLKYLRETFQTRKWRSRERFEYLKKLSLDRKKYYNSEAYQKRKCFPKVCLECGNTFKCLKELKDVRKFCSKKCKSINQWK